ncbi:Exocyst complex component EXO84A [Chlorella vulgaris]
MHGGDALTPAASWHPSSRGGGQTDGAGKDVPRTRSTLSRLTRSVSKLGSSKSSRARAQAAAAAAAAAAPTTAQPQASATHRSVGFIPGPSGAGAGLAAAASRTGGGGGLSGGLSGSSSLHDIAATTAARIKVFEEGAFNLEADLGSLSEKGVERLHGDLAQLDGEVTAHLKAAVHQHCAEFVRVTPGILRLEGEVQQLRSMLHKWVLGMNEVVQGLCEAGASPPPHPSQPGAGGGGGREAQQAQQAQQAAEASWRSTGDGAKWLHCLEDADVAVAERRLLEALSLLRRLEKLLQRFVAAADAGDPPQQARLDSMAAAVEQRRERLIAIAEQQVLQPIATSADIVAAADLLARVAGQTHAHSLVLEAHAAKLKRRQAALLRPANSGGGDADGADYAAALGQKLAAALAAAADDAAAVVGRQGGGGGNGGPGSDLSAAFLVWALYQTERACHLLRKHALLPFAAPAGLPAFGRAAFAFTAHCAALEASHGLQLVPTVQRELWPVLEQASVECVCVLSRKIRKLGETLRRAVAAEVEGLGAGSCQLPADLTCWPSLAAAFPSADYLLDELEATAADCRRLHSPRLAAAVRRAVTDTFQLYTAALAAALNRQLQLRGAAGGGVDGVTERLGAAAEAAMELSTLLLEQLLPQALAPLSEVCGDVCSQAALTEHLVRMGEALGMAAVPLTPGGSQATPPPPAMQEQQLEQQHRQPWGGNGGPEGGSRDEEVDGEAQGDKGAATGKGGGSDESGDERRRHTAETTDD